jgi:hypothetical protein
MQLPARIPQHITETSTFKIFSNVIPGSWIIRELTERDYGIDCYLEICTENYITGKMLLVQLKGEQSIEIHNKNNDPYIACCDIKPSTFNYWNNLSVVTIFIFIDIQNNVIFLQNVKEYIRKNFIESRQEKLTSIKIPITQILTKRHCVLFLNLAYESEINRRNLEYSVESFVLRFEYNLELLDIHFCRDCFLSMGEEIMML